MKTIIKYALHLLILLPFMAGAQHVPTSYDSDGDGIPDSVDKCVLVKGTAEFKGCPYAVKITADDRDGDGIADATDKCPDLFGTKANSGCPTLPTDMTTNSTEKNPVDPSGQATFFTTTSSSDLAERKDFKVQLLTILESSGTLFSNFKSGADKNDAQKFASKVCINGAKECYIKNGDKTFFYASYGSFENGADASAKSAALKVKLLGALGENEWQYGAVSSGYVEEYKASKRAANGDCIGSITTYVQKEGNLYNVYLTVEGKNSCTILTKQ
ncbi:MAG: OmpA family protein [Bacteroidota bacterium]|nr:OmpA family protein [Bacteroidota bacterium]